MTEAMDEWQERAGVVSHKEAAEIASRFNASHWNDGREKARYSIPADPRRDDDIRLRVYISQNEQREASRLARAEAAETALATATARIAELEAACSRFVEEVEASDDMKTLLCGCIGSTEQCLTPPTCAWCKLRDALAAKESAS